MTTPHRIHLATGILIRDATVLLVASRYPNHAQPLWNLPGGRQESDETIGEALVREFREETGLKITVGELRYVSESKDASTDTHFTNFAFIVAAEGEPSVSGADRHVVGYEWIPIAEVAARLVVTVVREPLCAVLAGSQQRYFPYHDAGATIAFAD